MSYTGNDIEDAINAALLQLFGTELRDNIPNDTLKLKRLTLAPLQDDPTKVAPYLVFAPAVEIGRQPMHGYGGWEIGGGQLWMTFYTCVVGTPRASSRGDAYAMINELSRRVEKTVIKHYDLSNVVAPGTLYSADQSEWVDAVDPEHMWARTVRKIRGGDTEFYGQAMMIWSYTFYRKST